jgi:methylated-DNA-protein-cysteine methyltransferase-like protein
VVRNSFYERVYSLVREVPPGKVVTYGDVARRVGSPMASRATGYALHALAGDTAVPWWRVVNRAGSISDRPGVGPMVQRERLQAEGVSFGLDGRVDLDRYGWDGSGVPGFGGQQ